MGAAASSAVGQSSRMGLTNRCIFAVFSAGGQSFEIRPRDHDIHYSLLLQQRAKIT
jgi:hypothetical protein